MKPILMTITIALVFGVGLLNGARGNERAAASATQSAAAALR
jgi:hypothetical protein